MDKDLEKTTDNVLVDGAEGETLQGFIYEQADKFFVDHIPFATIQDLPGICKFEFLNIVLEDEFLLSIFST